MIYDLEAEESVVGAVLHGQAFAGLGLLTSDFFAPHLRAVWWAIEQLEAPLDVVQVNSALQNITDAPTKAQLLQLWSSVPNPKSIQRYADLVKAAAIRRDLYEKCQEVQALLVTQGEYSECTALLSGLRHEVGSKVGISLSEALSETTEADTHPTGIVELDETLGGGFRPGQLVVIGARPGVGKTAFATQLALEYALSDKQVGFASLEMTAREVGGRLMSATDQDAALVTSLPITLVEGATSGGKLMSAFYGLLGQGCTVFILDYLQLVEGVDERRNSSIADLTRKLKLFALENQVLVISLSQLSRSTQHRNKISLESLRDSGAIEQDADVVILIERELGNEHAVFRIAKHRQGAIGTSILGFNEDMVSFYGTKPPPGMWEAEPLTLYDPLEKQIQEAERVANE